MFLRGGGEEPGAGVKRVCLLQRAEFFCEFRKSVLLCDRGCVEAEAVMIFKPGSVREQEGSGVPVPAPYCEYEGGVAVRIPDMDICAGIQKFFYN